VVSAVAVDGWEVVAAAAEEAGVIRVVAEVAGGETDGLDVDAHAAVNAVNPTPTTIATRRPTTIGRIRTRCDAQSSRVAEKDL
jgi:hypothetical protein